MDICSYHHDEICFTSRNCPLCDAVDNHNAKVADLESEIASLEKQVAELEERA